MAESFYNLSSYNYVGNNPINNIDPDGAYFFGLIGSTKEQREAARNYAEETGGTIENIHKKSVSVNYEQELGTERNTIVAVQNQKFDKDGGLVSLNGELNEKVNSKVDDWSESDNLIAKTTYELADDIAITLQASPFGAVLVDKNQRRHLNGNFATQSEVEDGFISGLLNVMPAGKGAPLLKKLNCAQFSKTFKGNLARLKAPLRGKLNRIYNKVSSKTKPSGKLLGKQVKSKSEEFK